LTAPVTLTGLDADPAPPPGTPRLRNVAILIETSGAYGRGLLRGVAKFNRERASWSTYFHPHGIGDAPPSWMRNWKGDGILARIATPALADMLADLGVPVVNLRMTPGETQFPYVGLDHARVSEMAAEHLRTLGLKNFAFYGYAPGVHAALDVRAEAFEAAITAAGHACHVFRAGGRPGEGAWDEEQAALAAWVASLPRPVGVMASNDEPGLFLLDACRRANLRVPDEVAVVGVDNDEHLCDLAIPPLTSVDVNGERIGYDAAKLLDEMMAGNQPAVGGDRFLVSPRGIVVRRSTDVVASEDPEVNRAVNFIRGHGGRPPSVAEVLAHTDLSRAALQQRMRKVLGRTVHEEIERVRLARVKELLIRSDLTIKQVASQTGFSSVQYLTRVFRAAVGETPAKYRQQRKD
jgi:LacI family transcriptional regulator